VGLPLAIGMDAGGSPAAVICSEAPNGRWRILDELVTEQGTGPLRFGRDLARLLRTAIRTGARSRPGPIPRHPMAATSRWARTAGSRSVEQEAGIRIDPAPTNSQIPRLEAVRRPLMTLIDGEPGCW
jgi:hypothetical protein